MNMWQQVNAWFSNRRSQYIEPNKAPQIKPGLGIVMPHELPPSSMTFPNTIYDRQSAIPMELRVFDNA